MCGTGGCPQCRPEYYSHQGYRLESIERVWHEHFGFLPELHGTPVVFGELGAWYDDPEDVRWMDWALSHSASRGFGVFFFCLNPNSADTGGLLGDDWTTPNTAKLAALEALPSTDLCTARISPKPRRCTQPRGEM